MSKNIISMNIHLPYKIVKREKWFVASCPLLDIHSQGKTEKKAKSNLVEALFLFFISCFERGTLDQALKECGFSPAKTFSKSKVTKELDTIEVPIPFHLNPRGTSYASHSAC